MNKYQTIEAITENGTTLQSKQVKAEYTTLTLIELKFRWQDHPKVRVRVRLFKQSHALPSNRDVCYINQRSK